MLFRSRTPDPYVPNVVRYQLRYIPIPFSKSGATKLFPEDFSIRERNEVVILYHFYHYNADVRKAGGVKIDKRIELQYIEAVEKVQRKMQWEIAQRGIGIETNPSSNFMIGTISRYDEHPITQFYNEDRKSTRLNSSHIQKSRMPSSA